MGCPRTGCPPARTPSLQDDGDGYYGCRVRCQDWRHFFGRTGGESPAIYSAGRPGHQRKATSFTDQSESTASLRTYGQILRRRKWLIIETVVVVTAIVVLVSMLQPTLYSATARIMAQSQSPSVSVAVGTSIDLAKPDERELQTLASLVVTPEILSAAKALLGWDDQAATLMADVSAEADPNTDIISVTAVRPDPEGAAALANASAAAFVTWRQKTLQKSLDEAITLLNEQIAAATTGSVTHTALVERRAQLEVLKPLVSGGLTIGEAAQPPSVPSSPKPLRNGVLAFAAGLVLGVGLAFVRESIDNKLHSAEEIAELAKVPVIAAAPEFRRQDRASAKVVVLDDPRSAAAEAYRFLRTNLEFVNFDNEVQVILVTSPQAVAGQVHDHRQSGHLPAPRRQARRRRRGRPPPAVPAPVLQRSPAPAASRASSPGPRHSRTRFRSCTSAARPRPRSRRSARASRRASSGTQSRASSSCCSSRPARSRPTPERSSAHRGSPRCSASWPPGWTTSSSTLRPCSPWATRRPWRPTWTAWWWSSSSVRPPRTR